MDTFPLKVEFDVELKGDFADGLAAAHQMIEQAMQYIVSYTNGCAGCTVAVLGAMFDMTLDSADRVENRYLNRLFVARSETLQLSYEEKRRRLDQHREEMRPRLEHYLREAKRRGAKIHIEDPPEDQPVLN